MMTNYLVLMGESALIMRVSHPGTYYPQSVAKYNQLSITAFVQTNEDQAFDEEAFKLLLKVIKNDMVEYDVDYKPQFLMR